jgi:ArsR family transcriptional regulator, arsenate/arsenite/antimonite-responsive transcriptional repressor
MEMMSMNIVKICDALAHETRYQIVQDLKNKSIGTCCDRIEYYEGGVSVGDVVKATGLAQSTVSKHLTVLEKAGVIYKEKRGLWTCYFLNQPVIQEYISALSRELG